MVHVLRATAGQKNRNKGRLTQGSNAKKQTQNQKKKKWLEGWKINLADLANDWDEVRISQTQKPVKSWYFLRFTCHHCQKLAWALSRLQLGQCSAAAGCRGCVFYIWSQSAQIWKISVEIRSLHNLSVLLWCLPVLYHTASILMKQANRKFSNISRSTNAQSCLYLTCP